MYATDVILRVIRTASDDSCGWRPGNKARSTMPEKAQMAKLCIKFSVCEGEKVACRDCYAVISRCHWELLYMNSSVHVHT